MLSSIFVPKCISCGGDCGYDEILCANCVAGLARLNLACEGYCADADFCYADYRYEGALRTALRRIKFDWCIRGVSQLARLCILANVNGHYDMIVPIPFHIIRRFARFVQPVSVIVREVAARLSVKVEMPLVRIRNTSYQAKLRRTARFENVKGAFELYADVDVHEKDILLVDDIMTTGATLAEAARVLKSGGASRVDVYSLAAGMVR
ncbi:ComF family protein [Deferribacterales bacterium RsTz2092]|nr:amidophosphoribosyltransferase [Deferribacterales bacterium]